MFNFVCVYSVLSILTLLTRRMEGYRDAENQTRDHDFEKSWTV
jgi:hypothetical protein